MRGIQGLILAIGLGIAGAMFNWAYLQRASSGIEEVQFIGISPDVTVNRGDKLTEDHLVPVAIPKQSVKNLPDFAYFYKDRQTVISMPVCRTLPGGMLLLKEDLSTPPPEIRFEENLPPGTVERGIFVPFNTKAFVPSLVNPGDYVDFLVPRVLAGIPTPAAALKPSPDGNPDSGPGGRAPAGLSGDVEIIGPFKILALGNRLGSVAVIRAAGVTPTQENVMLISVKLVEGQLEPKAQKLWTLLQRMDFEQAGIMIRPREKGK